MAVVYGQRPCNDITDYNNRRLDNIYSEDITHFPYNSHIADTLFTNYKAALINSELVDKWKMTHPHFWSSEDVLDWLYHVGEENNVDFEKFSAESFQFLKGEDLISMLQQEFHRYEPIYGELIYTEFLRLIRQKVNDNNFDYGVYCFDKAIKTENQMLPSICHIRIPVDEVKCEDIDSNSSDSETNVYAAIRKIMSTEASIDDVSREGSCYDANLKQKEYFNNSIVNNDLPDSILHLPTTSNQHQSDFPLNQIPYNFSHQKCEPHIAEETDSFRKLSYITLKNRTHCDFKPQSTTVSITKLQDEDNLKISHSSKSLKQTKRKLSKSSSKPTKCKQLSSPTVGHLKRKNIRKSRAGNHLWEFIRDLLHNEQYNPKYIKWEDHERGVFRFVASETVAKLWGEKKNNKTMNYEKLSRAMRFSRSVGYFAKIPASGTYPRKLCFQFGRKASGWRKGKH